VREELTQQLQAAMASCCPSEAAAERQRKQRGLVDLEWRGLGTPVLKFEGDVEGEGISGDGQQQQQEAADVKPQQKKKKKKRKSTAEPSAEQQQQQKKSEALQEQSSAQQGKPRKKQKMQN
jgi:hypothetical protein